jgi:dTDP-4-dehydrorhamnose 3,5-epimerase
MEPQLIIEPTDIQGVVVAHFEPVFDHRGMLQRIFCSEELRSLLADRQVVQINHSRTHGAGAIRGLHFQRPPHAELKMVQCMRGRVWDVAVDLRAHSPTFLRWHAEELFPEAAKMMVIPEGCAHGFQVLETDSELLYFHTAPYCRESEGGVFCNDPMLAIPWPLDLADLSPRDLQHPLISAGFTGIQL